jgi:dTDP-4-dehydrorhamnose reductase
MLGSSLAPFFTNNGRRVTIHGNTRAADIQGDFRDGTIVDFLLNKVQPDVVINLIALADVDACHRKPSLAWEMNVTTAFNISRWCQENDCRLVHISTDQVYSGTGLHLESATAPINAYGWSKAAGEIAAAQADALILRTNMFGPSQLKGRTSFSDWLTRETLVAKPITLFDDVLFSPLRMTTIAEVILHALNEWHSGTFNLGSRDGMSKASFGRLLLEHLGIDHGTLKNGLLGDVKLDSPRPKDMTLCVRRFEDTFSYQLPTLVEEIQQMEK